MDHIYLTLESDLCVASGESSGNAVDSDICIDAFGLPYIPARRIKGCLRQAAEDLRHMGYPEADEQKIRCLFGDAYGKEGSLQISDGTIEGCAQLRAYLQNIKGDDTNRTIVKAAHPVNIEDMFTEVYGSTKMQDGVKVDNTLRFTRVLKQYDPLDAGEKKIVFRFQVYLKDENLKNLLSACCSAMRHIGLNRNRGLGDVTAEFCRDERKEVDEEREKQKQELFSRIDNCKPDEDIEIFYTISFEEPVSVPGLEAYDTVVPGRSVIGCMSGNYLKEHDADDSFNSLFLTGDVRWSFLTPVIENRMSVPAPFMLMKLKNGGGRVINRYVQKDHKWAAQKPKTMDGCYAAADENGYVLAEPMMQTFYHHSVQNSQLYMQSAVEAGLVYGGNVVIKAGNRKLAKEVVRLLLSAQMGFGRSKSAQYATCKIKNLQVRQQESCKRKRVETGAPIFVVLESDVVINKNGLSVIQNDEVRRYIAEEIRRSGGEIAVEESTGDPLHPSEMIDSCQYKTISGYHTRWHLQKPHISAVKAGSVYCFLSAGEKLPEQLTIGEYLQEGLGRCRIYTVDELEGLQKIRRGAIDRITDYEVSDRKDRLKTAMRVYLARDVFRRYAREYKVKDKNIPISRLRLMLSEAVSYKDLCDRADTIKTSDRSSVNEKGRKVSTRELLEDFYGLPDKAPVEKMMKSEDGFWEELKGDPEAMEQVQKLWKLPLSLLLHNMHYRKGEQ